MTFLDLFKSPVNMTANGNSPPPVHGEKRKIKEIEEAGKKEVRDSCSSDTTA